MEDQDILIETDGTLRFVYSDTLARVFEGEEARTVRASHVEPFSRGGWFADMRPSGGPVMFANGTCRVWPESGGCDTLDLHTGFATRSAALDAERAWLRENKGV